MDKICKSKNVHFPQDTKKNLCVQSSVITIITKYIHRDEIFILLHILLITGNGQDNGLRVRRGNLRQISQNLVNQRIQLLVLRL